MKFFKKLALSAAFAGAAFGAQAAVVIDDFSVDQAQIEDLTNNGTGLWGWNTTASSSILGGFREIYVEKTGNASTTRGVNAGVELGLFYFSSETNQSGFAYLVYDGLGDGEVNPTGLGGVNLAAAGSGIGITVPSADANFPFAILAATDEDNFSVVQVTSTGPGSYTIPFAAFVPFGGSGADFSNIGAIMAFINVPGSITDVDLSIDRAVVPEPATLALAGLSLVGLAGLRRRQKA